MMMLLVLLLLLLNNNDKNKNIPINFTIREMKVDDLQVAEATWKLLGLSRKAKKELKRLS